MKVYILERGVYAERWISGVFASAEAAMRACPGNWEETEHGWHNDEDMDAAASVFEYEVQG